MAPPSSSPSSPAASSPAIDGTREGEGLPRRRIPTPPGVPAINTAALQRIVDDIDTMEEEQAMEAAALIVRSLREELHLERTLRMRAHADLLSLLSIIDTAEHRLAAGELQQKDKIAKRWRGAAMTRLAALDWSLDDVTYPDATTAIVPVEAHYDNGVTAYRVVLNHNQGWVPLDIDPHPPTDALAQLLAEEAVERLTAKEEREYADAAWEARMNP